MTVPSPEAGCALAGPNLAVVSNRDCGHRRLDGALTEVAVVGRRSRIVQHLP